MANTTDFGKYLKKMRIDCGENMSDMATKLAVSTAFLSAVETGKRNIPSSMVTKIYNKYEMSEEQKTSFFEAVANTNDKVDIAFQKGDTKKNTAVLSFATEVENLSDAQLEEIINILKKAGGNSGE